MKFVNRRYSVASTYFYVCIYVSEVNFVWLCLHSRRRRLYVVLFFQAHLNEVELDNFYNLHLERFYGIHIWCVVCWFANEQYVYVDEMLQAQTCLQLLLHSKILTNVLTYVGK